MTKTYFLFFFLGILPPTLFSQKLVMPVGHTARINSLVLSNDQKRVLTASEDRTAKLWDAETGHLLVSFKDATSAFFSEDDSKIVTHGETVSVWDAHTARLICSLPINKDTFYSQVFLTPDGKRLITTWFEYSKIWNAETGVLIADCGGSDGYRRIPGVLSADGAFFANIKDETIIQVWNTQTGKHITIEDEDANSQNAYWLAISPDSRYLVTDRTRIYDLYTGKKIGRLEYTEDFGAYDNISFNETGDILICEIMYNEPNLVKIFDFKTFSKITEIKMPDHFQGSYLSGDKNILLANTSDSIYAWDINNNEKKFTLAKGVLDFNALSGDGSIIFVRHFQADTLYAFDAATGKTLYKLFEPRINILTTNNDNTRIVTGNYDGYALMWNIGDQQLITSYDKRMTGLRDIIFDPVNERYIPFTIARSVSLKELGSGREIKKLSFNKLPYSGSFNKDGTFVSIIGLDSSATIWDTNTGEVVTKIRSKKAFITSATISSDNKLMVTTEGRYVKVYDIKGKFIKQFASPGEDFYDAFFSPGNKYIAAVCTRKTNDMIHPPMLTLWNMETGKLMLKHKGHEHLGIRNVKFDQQGNKLAFVSFDSLSVCYLQKNSIKLVTKTKVTGFWGVAFDPEGKVIVTTNNHEGPTLWDASTLKQKGHLILNDEYVFDASFSKDGTKLLTTSTHSIRIWDVATRKVNCELTDTAANISWARFNADESKIISGSENQSLKVWDRNSCRQLYNVFGTDENDMVYMLPNGYYMSSPAAAKKLHYVSDSLDVITFDQLDLRYNRPDKVLRESNPSDIALITSFTEAWQKRMRKMGVDTSLFDGRLQIPTAIIINREKLAGTSLQQSISLSIHLSDLNYYLDKMNVWINSVPVFGSRGINISNRNTKTFDTSITVRLSEGKNIIETAVVNEKGLESFKKPLQIKFDTKQQTSAVYFVGIGIDHFKDGIYDLQWSVADIRDLVNAFKEKYKGTNIFIDTLFNESVTVENVRALKAQLQRAGVDDKVIVAYSGHGLLSKDFDYYLSTYDVNFDEPQKQGLAYDELERLLDSTASRKKLMLIDACHSGEVDKEELARYEIIQKSLDSTKKGVTIRLKDNSKRVGIKSSFDLMQELFTNIGRGTGATIISAAGGMQFALERGDLRNGVFTYSILELMQQKRHATLSELKLHVNDRVVELTKGAQVPTARNDNNYIDWEVW